MVFLYNLFIRSYLLALKLASLGNKKAMRWIEGRKDLFNTLQEKIKPGDRIIWIHCASAGELEQGKPVIEQLKKSYPAHKILVSVFSPSGFQVAEKYGQADLLTYLPLDEYQLAERFVAMVRPELAVFVKYEYWYHHLRAISSRKIPLLLVSSIFREDQVFFRWYGGFFKKMLSFFSHIFVQDEPSLMLLRKQGIQNCSVGGDTRFDRVVKIAGSFEPIKSIEEFLVGQPSIVAGSTWKEDEENLREVWNDLEQKSWKLVIAPHEIHPEHLEQIRKLFPGAVFYSDIKSNPGSGQEARVLVIDNIGMLSRLYRYATICYVGGGFNKSGIHNTLEAAVYGKPVFFGPNYSKFREARELVNGGGAFSYSHAGELKSKLDGILNNPSVFEKAGTMAGAYVTAQTGATARIMAYIQENRLLTS